MWCLYTTAPFWARLTQPPPKSIAVQLHKVMLPCIHGRHALPWSAPAHEWQRYDDWHMCACLQIVSVTRHYAKAYRRLTLQRCSFGKRSEGGYACRI